MRSINDEFERRSRAMGTLVPDGPEVLLAFAALRLEFGWATTPISSDRIDHPGSRAAWKAKQLEMVTKEPTNRARASRKKLHDPNQCIMATSQPSGGAG